MIVFLDVDGTYAEYGTVPAVHTAAVRRARHRGHRVLLCTGRSRSMLPPDVLEAGFDGLVASAGAYVEIGGRVVRDRRFPIELAERAIGVLDLHDVAYVLESAEDLQGPSGINERIAGVFARRRTPSGQPRTTPGALRDVRPRRPGSRFAKITVFESSVPIARLGGLVGPTVATIPSSLPSVGTSAGEIYLADVNKSVGARIATRVLAARGAERTVAVGDGLNDIEVLAWADLGVAIAGSDAALLAVADRVIPGPGDGGVARLFEELLG